MLETAPASAAYMPWPVYRKMLRSRLFEEAVSELWNQGLISGEMHLSTGEEAIAAGTVLQLEEGDALALDHRPTSPLLMRGVDPVRILREFLGRRDGLCGGMGGHMHLFSPEHLAASSGIVGASGPAAAGFALAGQHLRPGKVTVAFFGEGALNQGMLLESMNLAVIWQLPILFICKDNRWAITTLSPDVSGGTPASRAQGFGMRATEGDGSDVRTVWELAGEALARARRGEGPTLLHFRCSRPEQHMLGDPLLQVARRPVQEMRQMAGPLTRAIFRRRGAPMRERTRNVSHILSLIRQIGSDATDKRGDPLQQARTTLAGEDEAKLLKLEEEVVAEASDIVRQALAEGTR